MHARTKPPQPQRRVALGCGRLAPPPELDHRPGQPPSKCVNQFQAVFLSELILHYIGGAVGCRDGPIQDCRRLLAGRLSITGAMSKLISGEFIPPSEEMQKGVLPLETDVSELEVPSREASAPNVKATEAATSATHGSKEL